MCPACLTTTLALVTAGVTSTGGITALVVSTLRAQGESKGSRKRERVRSLPSDGQNTVFKPDFIGDSRGPA